VEITRKQLREMQILLDELKVSLSDLLAKTEVGSQPVKLKDNAGRLSRMDEMHNQSILIANRTVIKNRLIQAELAQQRMKDGSYGYCTSCDEPIALPRLQASPEAPRCIQCQSLSESDI
jgi:DnaK suppressor protein|tara:strand:- start:734 stop:1090 length:357 start_codon:yes stop_codon:yes gene_type:complete